MNQIGKPPGEFPPIHSPRTLPAGFFLDDDGLPIHLPPVEPQPHSVSLAVRLNAEDAIKDRLNDSLLDELRNVGGSREVPTSTNPKDIAARGKCPLWLVPPVAEHVEARVLEHGAVKYGPYNWRDQPIQLSTYLSACKRHLAAFIDGEDVDPESGLIHLAHARATLGIILDAQSHGTLIDDRPKGKNDGHS